MRISLTLFVRGLTGGRIYPFFVKFTNTKIARSVFVFGGGVIIIRQITVTSSIW